MLIKVDVIVLWKNTAYFYVESLSLKYESYNILNILSERDTLEYVKTYKQLP